MLKIYGLILIIVSGAGMGFAGSRELSAGLKAREMLLRMVILLKGEIRCGNASLSDAMAGAAAKLPGAYGRFLRKTAQETEARRGESFGVIFRKNAEIYLKELRLHKEEQEQLFSLGDHLGYLDLKMQIRQLEFYEEEMEESIRLLKSQLPERKKVRTSLGILFGIFLAVLVF